MKTPRFLCAWWYHSSIKETQEKHFNDSSKCSISSYRIEIELNEKVGDRLLLSDTLSLKYFSTAAHDSGLRGVWLVGDLGVNVHGGAPE